VDIQNIESGKKHVFYKEGKFDTVKKVWLPGKKLERLKELWLNVVMYTQF
jgi:hypothetical protein